MTQLVPYVFQNLGGAPVSQLDTNLGYVSGKWVSVKDAAFGAKGDGATDDYAAIVAAITYVQGLGTGGTVFFPPGTYAFKTPIVIASTPVRLVGSGMSAFVYTIPAAVGTTLKYTGGATSSPAVSFTGAQAAGMAHFGIDCNGLADVGLQVDSCTFGVYEDIHVTSMAKRGVIVRNTAATAPSCSWNTFRNISIDINSSSGITGMWITGDGVTNTCHNTFQNFHINFGGTSTSGIDLGYCDNNRFIGIYESRSSGTGAGVNVIDTEHAGFPVGNYFFHLQASAGGWVQQATSNAWNVIIGYDRSNGEPAPVTNNKPLLWLDGWGVWNTILAGGAGAAGGGDVRTALNAIGGADAAHFASIIIGYQGNSINFFDADIHHFRDHAQANDLTIQAGALSARDKISTSKYFSSGGGASTQFGKSFAAVAANANADIATAASGLYVIRDLTDGGVIVVNADVALGVIAIVSDPSARGATVDPGAGGNKLFITNSGTTFRVTNRFAAAKDLAIACTMFFGTP